MSDSNPPITKKGLPWPFVVKIMAWGAPLILAATLAYFRTQFASAEELDTTKASITQHVSAAEVRFHSLEEFKTRAEVQSGAINENLRSLATEQSSQRAVLTELLKGQERVLNRIDQLADRPIKADK